MSNEVATTQEEAIRMNLINDGMPIPSEIDEFGDELLACEKNESGDLTLQGGTKRSTITIAKLITAENGLTKSVVNLAVNLAEIKLFEMYRLARFNTTEGAKSGYTTFHKFLTARYGSNDDSMASCYKSITVKSLKNEIDAIVRFVSTNKVQFSEMKDITQLGKLHMASLLITPNNVVALFHKLMMDATGEEKCTIVSLRSEFGKVETEDSAEDSTEDDAEDDAEDSAEGSTGSTGSTGRTNNSKSRDPDQEVHLINPQSEQFRIAVAALSRDQIVSMWVNALPDTEASVQILTEHMATVQRVIGHMRESIKKAA